MTALKPAEALARERASVEAQLTALLGTFVPADGLGFGKRVGDGTQIAVERITDVAKQEMLLAKLAAIAVAEERLEAGTYGLCEVCEKPIPEERLEARPQAVRCVQHAT